MFFLPIWATRRSEATPKSEVLIFSGRSLSACRDALHSRMLPVTGFENYLLFYIEHEDCVDVIRLLHGARDLSRRFVKKQQMQWTLRGAHLLLQTRTEDLNNELEETFRRSYPQFRAEAA